MSLNCVDTEDSCQECFSSASAQAICCSRYCLVIQHSLAIACQPRLLVFSALVLDLRFCSPFYCLLIRNDSYSLWEAGICCSASVEDRQYSALLCDRFRFD